MDFNNGLERTTKETSLSTSDGRTEFPEFPLHSFPQNKRSSKLVMQDMWRSHYYGKIVKIERHNVAQLDNNIEMR